MATGVERFQKTAREEGNMIHTGRTKNKAKERNRTRNAIETGIKSAIKQVREGNRFRQGGSVEEWGRDAGRRSF